MCVIGGGESANTENMRESFDSRLHQLSHDLRTPLNHINGFAELLLMDANLSVVHADYVRAILVGSEELRAAVISYLDRVEQTAPGVQPPRRIA